MLSLGDHVYKKDKIVIGGDLRALLYAFSNELPVIYVDAHKPVRFDELIHTNLSNLGFSSGEPVKQAEIWSRLNFFLGLSGLLPLSGAATNMRVSENQLVVATKNARNIKFDFNKLVIYKDEGIAGLTRVSEEKRKKSRVIDWVNVRSGCRHDVDYLEDDDDFVKEIYFYPSDRSDNKKLKDLAAVSYLTDEQLRDFDFSDTMAKFKIKKMMKKAGIRGARNGRDVNRPDHYKYYAVKIEPAERQIFADRTRIYEPDVGRFE